MRRFALLALFLLLALAPVLPVEAQAATPLTVEDPAVSYVFGEPLTIQARLQPSGPVSEAFILFRADGEAATRLAPITIGEDGVTSYTYRGEQGPLRPFATVRFWYRVKLQTGEELVSAEFPFRYEDNRFPWQLAEGENLRLHWYAGEAAFGQDALDAARRGLQRAQELLLVSPAAPIDIYIYASTTDLQKALEIGGLSWAGGHASPDLRVGLVSIAQSPEQGLEMDREIPHELAHILTYDLTGENYAHLPVWLREGLASRSELTTNPDYPLVVSQAAKAGTLIPFGQLCGSFPPDSGSAFQAYAQSDALTSFVIKKHGQSGLLALIHAYADGLDCEQGPVRALGQTLTQLETDWINSEHGALSGLSALGNFGPHLVLLFVILVVPLANALLFKGAGNDRN